MNNELNTEINFTVDFSSADIDSSDLEELTQRIFQKLDQLEEIEHIGRIRDVPPKGVKAGNEFLGKMISGLLSIKSKILDFDSIIEFLSRLLNGRKFSVKIESNGRSLELESEGGSKQDLLDLMKAAKEFSTHTNK